MTDKARAIWRVVALLVGLQAVRAAVLWLLLRSVPASADAITRFQLFNGASLVVVGLLALAVFRPSAADLGLSLDGMSRRARFGAAVGCGAVAALVATSALFGWQALAMNAVFGLAVPALEEGVFRGWAYGRLEHVLTGRLSAVIVTTALFMAWHLGHADVFLQHPKAVAWAPLIISKLAIALVLGLGLGWLRERTGRVYAPFVAHAAWNLFAP